jgi:hypothetical protein
MGSSWNTLTERKLFFALVDFVAMEDEESSTDDSLTSSDDDNDDESLGEILMNIGEYGETLFNLGKDNMQQSYQPDLVVDNLPDNDRTQLDFRFRKHDLKEICNLVWPRLKEYLDGDYNKIKLPHRHYVHFETGILMLLYRLIHPMRIRPEMETRFLCSPTKISYTISVFVVALSQLATKYFSDITIWKNHVEYCAYLVSVKTDGVCNNVFGFIDGTLRPICRPSRHQQIAYSGYKRQHGIKFQSVVFPNGLIAALHGPEPGSRHDLYLLGESKILDQLRAMIPNGNYSLYGDPAYPQSAWLHGGYRNPPPNSDQAKYNKLMSSVRESVEWGFNGIIQQFAFLDYKKKLMIYKVPIAAYYISGAFLQNLRTCLYGSEISLHFVNDEVVDNRMNIHEYLGLADNN